MTRAHLVANIEDIIWTELERQSKMGMGPYVDRGMGMIDASGAGLNMTAVAEAVATLFVDDQDDCSCCHSPSAIGVWGNPMVKGGEESMRVQHRTSGQQGILVSRDIWYAVVKFDGEDGATWVASDSIREL